MAGRAVAVDVGSSTIKVLAVKAGKQGLSVTGFAVVDPQEGEAELKATGLPLKGAVVGVGGRDMILRYTQVPPSPDWQLRNLMDLELQDLQGQSGGDLSADYNLLPVRDEEAGVDTVLMALARNDGLARIADLVEGAGGSVEAHVPTCIAIYNAFVKCGPVVEEDQVSAVVAIGRDTMDVALLRGTDLMFARNLSSGGKVLDDAIASAFNVAEGKAEKLKIELIDLDPQSRGRFASGQAEKVTVAAGGAASMIVSGIQSSLAFCQTQTKVSDLRLDRVFLCGGTANVRGLKGMLREALRCPVEQFDPFERCDLSELSPDAAEELKTFRAEAVAALGLAAGRVDSNLYALEILPERVKRRQRFLQRTVFNIAAGGVAAATLAALFVAGQSRMEAATRVRDTAVSQVRQLKSVHDQASALHEKNAAQRTLVGALAERAVPLDGSLRVLRALQETIKPEFWIDSVELKPSQQQRGGRSEQKLVFVVKGKGKPVGGVDVGTLYQEFANKFMTHPLIKVDGAEDNVVATTKLADAGVTEFTFEVDVLPDPKKEN